MFFRGAAKYVRLGDLDIFNTTDDAEPQDYTVERTFAHPDYRWPAKYHDIGLIELNEAVNVTNYVKMACLDTERIHNQTKMIACGWGQTEAVGPQSSILIRVDLDVVSSGNCSKTYPPDERQLPNGVIEDEMLCAGGEMDTCLVREIMKLI